MPGYLAVAVGIEPVVPAEVGVLPAAEVAVVGPVAVVWIVHAEVARFLMSDGCLRVVGIHRAYFVHNNLMHENHRRH